MSLNDRNSWQFPDQTLGWPLDEIQPIAARAQALLARSASPLVETEFVRLQGVVSMLDGLEHHFQNYMSELARLRPFLQRRVDAIRHEAVAWLNRAGQLNAFCRSKFVSSRIGEPTLPVLSQVMPFRNKHAAHRAIDVPRKDAEVVQISSAVSMSPLGGSHWHARDLSRLPEYPSHTDCFYAFQLYDGSQQVDLVIERQHPLVSSEAYAVLNKLLT